MAILLSIDVIFIVSREAGSDVPGHRSGHLGGLAGAGHFGHFGQYVV
jgi:hypothetical protein